MKVFMYSVMGALVAGALAFGWAGSAMALTIPSGHVITDDGTVVPAEESATTQKLVELNGYSIAGGKVIIGVGDGSIVLDQADLIGKSRDEIKELIVDAIVDSGFASGSIHVDGLGDATDAANKAAQEVYQEAVEAAVYADNIANGVSDSIAERASKGFEIGNRPGIDFQCSDQPDHEGC